MKILLLGLKEEQECAWSSSAEITRARVTFLKHTLEEIVIPFEGRDRITKLMRSLDEVFLRSFSNFEEVSRS